jgi:hypothetical protein
MVSSGVCWLCVWCGCSMRSRRWGFGSERASERRLSCGGVQDQWADRGIEGGFEVVLLLLLYDRSRVLCQARMSAGGVLVWDGVACSFRPLSLFLSRPRDSQTWRLHSPQDHGVQEYLPRHMIRHLAPPVICAIVFFIFN